MREGTQIVSRPICPEDEPLMVKFHAGLSDRTVYLRYFSSLSLASRTAHERLVRICFADPERETVLVATHTDKSTGEQNIVAVGRLNKLLPKSEAEVAILFSDEYQGRGRGGQSFRPLVQVAHAHTLDPILAEMLRHTTTMTALIKNARFRL